VALITCSECSKQVSDKATACPGCGAPIAGASSPAGTRPAAPAPSAPPTSSRQGGGWGRAFRVGFYGILLLLLAGLAISIFGNNVRRQLRPLPAPAPPKVLFSDRIELKEGAAQGYPFKLPSPRVIEVSVASMPKPVNVMLMNEDQWRAYAEVKGQLFGGKFWYEKALSRQNVMKWSARSQLAPGDYRIVLERPQEDILFGHSTVADVTITAL
jgi:hypothetical protein